jgi:hypothetical protein
MKPKLLVGIGIGITVVVLLWLAYAAITSGTSDGYRDGYIQKFSHKKGWFVSSWEGELAMPGFGGSQTKKSGQESGNVWDFFVEDAKVIDAIQEIDASQFVRVYYHEAKWAPGHWCKYEATRVEIRRGKTNVPQGRVE